MQCSAGCPFCRGVVEIRETTTQKQAEVGLVYLKTKCVPCNARIHSAGVGEAAAVKDMEKKMSKRIGTTPSDWFIHPMQAKGRRRR